MPEIRAHVVIHGRVQGVWFRDSTREEAERFGVSGWVRNVPDGTVEAVFEGEEEAVDALVRWCHEGPRAASVERVEEERSSATGEFAAFTVR